MPQALTLPKGFSWDAPSPALPTGFKWDDTPDANQALAGTGITVQPPNRPTLDTVITPEDKEAALPLMDRYALAQKRNTESQLAADEYITQNVLNPVPGVKQLAKGVEELNAAAPQPTIGGQPIRLVAGKPAPSPNVPPKGSLANAGSDIIEGAMGAGKPLAAAGYAFNPLPFLAGLGAGTLIQKGTEKASAAMGASPETSRFAGNVGGFVGGVLGAKGGDVLASPETQAHIGSTIERAKSAVAEVPNAIADNLHERAVTQYQQALNPTKERTKYLAQKVAPEMLDRGIVASSPKSLAERAGNEAELATEQLEATYDKLPADASVPTKPIIDSLEGFKGDFQDRIPISREEFARDAGNGAPVDIVKNPDGSETYVRIATIDDNAVNAANAMQRVIQQYGESMPVRSARKVRQIFDEAVAKAGGYEGRSLPEGSLLDAKKVATSAIRENLASTHPELVPWNKEINFWLNVQKIAQETAKRRVGQQGGILAPIAEQGGRAIGAVAGEAAGGPVGAVLGGAIGGKVAAKLTRLTHSTGWRTFSAVAKNKLANALASGDWKTANSLLDGIDKNPPRGGLPFLPPNEGPAPISGGGLPFLPQSPSAAGPEATAALARQAVPGTANLPESAQRQMATTDVNANQHQATYLMDFLRDLQQKNETGVPPEVAAKFGVQIPKPEPEAPVENQVPVERRASTRIVNEATQKTAERVEGRTEQKKALELQPQESETKQQKGIPAGSTGEMPLSELKVNPHRFQYKLGTDAEGVGTLLKDQTKFNPDLANVISVWRDPADNKFYVVNGHHRFELAKRTGQESVSVRHINAANATEARSVGALQNIAEGRGTAVDAAKFLRDSGITPEDLNKHGVSMGEATAAKGVSLARLDPDLFNRVVQGQIPVERAVAIGDSTNDPAEQKAIVDLIAKKEKQGKHISNETLRELVRFVKGSEQNQETTADLFGSQEITKSLALEKAEVSSYIKQQLAKDKKLFGFVSKGERAQELERGNNIIDVNTSRTLAEEATQGEEVYNKLSERAGNVASALDEAARKLANGENANVVKQQAYDKVRAEISSALGRGQGQSAEGNQGPAGRVQAQREFSVEAPDPTAGYRQNSRRGELDWGGSGLSDEQIATWIKSKSLQVEPAGVQNTLFGSPEPMYRLTHTDSDGNVEHAVVPQSVLDRLSAGTRNATKAQPRLFGVIPLAVSAVAGAALQEKKKSTGAR